MIATQEIEKIELANGGYAPSQASDVLNALIQQKINFYKIVRLSARVGDEDADTAWIDEKISTLKREQESAKHVIEEARILGRQFISIVQSNLD
ncbi:hypothetical protein OAE48_01140 [Flavobacteriales bacterium]|nr:hypothetical protein [Flavobacteriales bacterium]